MKAFKQLASAGIDLAAQINRGALILSSDQGHLVDGRFDVERMIGLLERAVKQSLADGFAGLWASGDMTWEFGNESNFGKLLDYERRLDQFMRKNPALSGVCLYHRDTLPREVMEAAYVTHPAIYVSATLSQLNSRYTDTAPAKPFSSPVAGIHERSS